MTTQALGSPVLSGSALRSVNFFNGRLLTGDDLADEQSAQESRLQRLAQLDGEGIAHGLEVQETAGSSTPQNPVVTVASGLAVSRSGLALSLPSSIDLALAGGAPGANTEPGGLFAPCQPFTPGTYTAGAGVYLLWIGPASQSEGLAPVNGLGNQTAPCNVDDYIETVQLGLIRLALIPDQLADSQHLQNLVAYLCFAPQAPAGFTSNPFGPPLATYGLIDELRAQILTDDQVPLALIAWDADAGIEFVDLWSVRRRITRPAVEDDFAAFARDRRRAEGEAMFLQFQGQIEDSLLNNLSQQLIRAGDRFEQLPAAGLLPLAASVSSQGFDLSVFFAGMKTRSLAYLNGAQVTSLIQTSFDYPPIDVASPEVIWLYLVRENNLADGPAPQLYLLFANGHIPYAANARFDLSYWDYSDFGLI